MAYVVRILTLFSVFSATPLLTKAESLFFTSEYLSDAPVGKGRRVMVFQESLRLQEGNAKLILDPNGCGLDQFGDAAICTLIAPQVFDCELKSKKLADPLELDRTVFELISKDFALPGRLALVTGTKSGFPTRLIIDSEMDENRRRVIPLFKIDPAITLAGNNTVPILRASQPLAIAAATHAVDGSSKPANGSSTISSILRSRASMANYEQVNSVDRLEGRLEEDSVTLRAFGTVATSGWSNPVLMPVVYKVAPKNGLWEYQFVAEAPGGTIVNPVVTQLETPEISIDLHETMKGVRVTAQQGEMVLRFVQELEEPPKPLDQLTVNGVSVDGNVLSAKVIYSGGCMEHDFQLSWDRAYLESNPPRVHLRLIHNANEDACEALIRETLSFLLPPMDPCIIRLSTADGESHEVRYQLD